MNPPSRQPPYLQRDHCKDETLLYPVSKPQHLCWGWWKYLQKQEQQLLIEGGVKALPFLMGVTHKGADEVVTRMKGDLDTYAARFGVFADKVWREEYLNPPSLTTSCASSSIGASMAMKSAS